MYLEYFDLKESPFSLTPDPQYLFMSGRHREGLAHLLYGVQQSGGFVQLTGEIGSGKTTLCRCLIRQLPPDTDIALILNPRLTVTELLAAVCDELRVPYPEKTTSVKVLVDALNERLLESHGQRRRTVLIIDEAQNLDGDVLEQVRLLTNLETAQEKLLQIILIGQPELLAILKSRRLRQLSQRITARYHLEPLSRAETYAYVRHRLLVAGRREPLFTPRALRSVYACSRGVPRVINIVCDRALLGAYAQDRRRIGAGIVRRASRETQGKLPLRSRLRPGRAAGVVLAALLLAAGAFLFSPAVRSLFERNASFADVSSVDALSVNAPAPTPAPPAVGEPAAPLEAVLAGTDNAAASFTALYGLWGEDIPVGSPDSGCRAGEREGFECLFLTGNWPKVRRYNLPVILELVMPDGGRRRATLVELGDDQALLDIGGRRQRFSLEEINRLWDGAFILAWKPPFPARILSAGMRGEEVGWVRGALDRLEGAASAPGDPLLFDEGLKRRVSAFQGRKGLIPDGMVGTETVARLLLDLDGGPVLRR